MDQFVGVARFDQIVGGARAHRADGDRGVGFGRRHDHAHPRRGGAQLRQEFESGFVAERDVEHAHVEHAARHRRYRGRGVVRDVDLVAGVLQAQAEGAQHGAVVVDQQYAFANGSGRFVHRSSRMSCTPHDALFLSCNPPLADENLPARSN